MSTSSNEFAFHVPVEYDYLFISEDKEAIAAVLKKLFAERANEANQSAVHKANNIKLSTVLPVQRTEHESLKDHIVNKSQAKKLTFDQRRVRTVIEDDNKEPEPPMPKRQA